MKRKEEKRRRERRDERSKRVACEGGVCRVVEG